MLKFTGIAALADLFLLPFAGSAPITRVRANIPSHPCLLPSLSLAPPPLGVMPTFITPEFSNQLGGLALEESLKTVKGLALAIQALIDEGKTIEAKGKDDLLKAFRVEKGALGSDPKFVLKDSSIAKPSTSSAVGNRDLVDLWSLLFAWGELAGNQAILGRALAEAAKAGVDGKQTVGQLLRVIDSIQSDGKSPPSLGPSIASLVPKIGVLDSLELIRRISDAIKHLHAHGKVVGRSVEEAFVVVDSEDGTNVVLEGDSILSSSRDLRRKDLSGVQSLFDRALKLVESHPFIDPSLADLPLYGKTYSVIVEQMQGKTPLEAYELLRGPMSALKHLHDHGFVLGQGALHAFRADHPEKMTKIVLVDTGSTIHSSDPRFLQSDVQQFFLDLFPSRVWHKLSEISPSCGKEFTDNAKKFGESFPRNGGEALKRIDRAIDILKTCATKEALL